MKLVLHIVRKDLRKLRWQLATWLLVVALHLAIGFALVAGVDLHQVSAQHLEKLAGGLRAVGYLLTFVITAMLVQEDGLVGSDQFWLTRPISNRRLLGAKVAGWFLLLVLPQLVLSFAWWITCGFEMRELALATLEVVVIQAAIALPAALVASLTDTLSRFLVWAFVFVFAAVIIPGTLSFWVPNRFTEQNMPLVLLGLWGLIALAIAVVTVRQFLRREVKRSLVTLGVSFALALLTTGVVNLTLAPMFNSKPQWTDWHAERVENAKVTVHSWHSGKENKATPEWVFYTTFGVRDLPRELLLTTRWEDAIQQTWRWPGGPEVTRKSGWISPWNLREKAMAAALKVGPAQVDEETERFREKLTEERHARNPNIGEWDRRSQEFRREVPTGFNVQASLLPSTIERIRRTPPAFEATVRLRAMRPELWIETPPRATGWHARHGHGFRIERPDFRLPGAPIPAGSREMLDPIRLPVVVAAAELGWDQVKGRVNYWDYWYRPSLITFHQAGGDIGGGQVSEQTHLDIGSVRLTIGYLNVWRPLVRRGDKWLERDPNWFEGLKLALVGFREEARFTREVRVERFSNER